jgi:hypothetical protein
MDSIQIDNLMRGAVARIGQLLEVIATSMTYNTLVVSMAIFSVYLVTAVRTPEAIKFAPYVVAGSIAMAAKGGFMLHRKWDEYAKAEKASQALPGQRWPNPSVFPSEQNRTAVLIANILAVAAIALPVLIHCYSQMSVKEILPSLTIVIFSLWAWFVASK